MPKRQPNLPQRQPSGNINTLHFDDGVAPAAPPPASGGDSGCGGGGGGGGGGGVDIAADLAERRRIWEENQRAVQRNKNRVYSYEEEPLIDTPAAAFAGGGGGGGGVGAAAQELPIGGLTPAQSAQQRRKVKQLADEEEYKVDAERIRRENFKHKQQAAARMRGDFYDEPTVATAAATPAANGDGGGSGATRPPPAPGVRLVRAPSSSSDTGGSGPPGVGTPGRTGTQFSRQGSNGAVDYAELDARAAAALNKLRLMDAMQRAASEADLSPANGDAGGGGAVEDAASALPTTIAQRIEARQAELQAQRAARTADRAVPRRPYGAGAAPAGPEARARARWEPTTPDAVADRPRGARAALSQVVGEDPYDSGGGQGNPTAAAALARARGAVPVARQHSGPQARQQQVTPPLLVVTKAFPGAPLELAQRALAAINRNSGDDDGSEEFVDADMGTPQGSGSGDDDDDDASALRAISEEQQYNDMLETMLNLSIELEASCDGDNGTHDDAARAETPRDPAETGTGAAFDFYGDDSFEDDIARGAATPTVGTAAFVENTRKLRELLTAQLGRDRFSAAYQRLLAVAEEEDDDRLARDVNVLLGDDHQDALGDILHLIDCEEQKELYARGLLPQRR